MGMRAFAGDLLAEGLGSHRGESFLMEHRRLHAYKRVRS